MSGFNFSRTIPVDEKALQIYKRFLFRFTTFDITFASLRAMNDLYELNILVLESKIHYISKFYSYYYNI